MLLPYFRLLSSILLYQVIVSASPAPQRNLQIRAEDTYTTDASTVIADIAFLKARGGCLSAGTNSAGYPQSCCHGGCFNQYRGVIIQRTPNFSFHVMESATSPYQNPLRPFLYKILTDIAERIVNPDAPLPFPWSYVDPTTGNVMELTFRQDYQMVNQNRPFTASELKKEVENLLALPETYGPSVVANVYDVRGNKPLGTLTIKIRVN